MLKTIIFDVDGTLVDSNDAHARAWTRALAECGWDVSFDRVRPLIGMGSDKLLPTLIGIDAESLDGARIVKRRAAIFERDELPSLRPTRGARRLLGALAQARFKIAIASSAQKNELDKLLRVADATDLIEHATSADDAERSKPDPDIVRAALEQSGGSPEEAMMVGDTPYDVDAARRAGVKTIAFRTGGWSDDALKGAVAIYDDPLQLLEQLDASPLQRLPAGDQ